MYTGTFCVCEPERQDILSVAVCYNVLRSVAVCCSWLQCVAVDFDDFLIDAVDVHWHILPRSLAPSSERESVCGTGKTRRMLQYVAVWCSVLQCAAECLLQHVAMNCSMPTPLH